MIIAGLLLVLGYILAGWYAQKLHLFDDVKSKRAVWILSSTSGLLLAALLFKFLPRFYNNENTIWYLLLVCITFLLFYGLSRNVVSSNNPSVKKKAVKRLSQTRLIYLIIHHIIVGILFSQLAKGNITNLILSGIPIIMLKTSATLQKAYSSISKSSGMEKIIDGSIVLVFIMSYFFINLPEQTMLFALALISGTIFFVIINLVLQRDQFKLIPMLAAEGIYAFILFIPVILRGGFK